jgi:GNAT superfamily N-acetyltransferase
MTEIVSVAPGSVHVAAARSLFTDYRVFLQSIARTHWFDFARFDEEIATLPAPYACSGGEVLLALVEECPAACISYRLAEKEPGSTCEIKRLFVAATRRKQGLARALVAECVLRAAARGFTRAILDTDIDSMPAAYATYRSLGFTEYTPLGAPHPPYLRFLERSLN